MGIDGDAYGLELGRGNPTITVSIGRRDILKKKPISIHEERFGDDGTRDDRELVGAHVDPRLFGRCVAEVDSPQREIEADHDAVFLPRRDEDDRRPNLAGPSVSGAVAWTGATGRLLD